MNITTNNYFREIETIGIHRLPDALKKSHEFVVKITDNGSNWNIYQSSEGIRKTVDLYFEKLGEFASAQEHENPKKDKGTKAGSKKEKKVISSKPKKEKTHETGKEEEDEEHTPVHRVEHLNEEMKFIKRFVGLHNKVKSENSILNFLKALQKAIVQKIISKTSPFADEIRLIQEKLVKAYNAMSGEVKLMLGEKDLARLVGIAGGEEVYHSIPIIKRFIGMEGRAIEPVKIDNFIHHIEHVIEKDKLENDPYSDKVSRILNSLKKYLKDKDGRISVSETELNGLNSIVKGCSCHHHLGSHRGRKVVRYGHHSLSGLSDGVMTAEQVANQHFDMLPFSGQWANLIGKPAKNFSMMLHGEPGSGKTTFMMKFIKYLSSLGRVLYVSSEEFNSVTLQQKVQQYLYPIPANVHFCSDLSSVNVGEYDFVVLDSINDLGLDLEQFKIMHHANPNTAFILILQHTKAGQFKGGKEWEHEAEIAGKVTEGVISIYKNRYGVKGNMDFFNY